MKTKLPVLLSFTVLLAGCFGGSGGSSSSGGGSTLSGLAATGAPVSNGTVEVKGKNGTIVSTTTDSTGAYGVDVASLNPPFLILVTTPTGEKLISIASERDLEEGNKVNVTPLSHAIVANVFELKDADSLFEDFETESAEYTDTKLDDKKQALKDSLVAAGVLGASGVLNDTSLDLMNGTFVAGSGAGLDKLLDALDVDITTSANIEIKLKGNSQVLIDDDVTSSTDVIDDVDAADITAIATQLTNLEEIKAFYVSAGNVYSGMVPCNGLAVDDGSACDKDTLQSSMVAFLHANYKWNGLGRTEDVWSWMCRIDAEGNDESDSRANCNYIKTGNITFKDVTIIEFKELAGTDSEAIVSMNSYMDGEYMGNDNEYLKKEAGVWKFNGNQRKYEVGINAQSIHKSVYNLSNVLQTSQEKFGAEINLWVDSSQVAFLAATDIVLEAVNEDNSSNVTLNTALGNAAGVSLSFNDNNNIIVTSRKFINYETGEESAACNSMVDPCGPNHNAQNINLSTAALAAMESKQKFKFSYNDGSVQTDYFYVNKPMSLTASNAANVTPSFDSNTLCTVPASSYLVSAPTGISLDYGSVYLGLQENDMSFTGVNDHGSVSGQDDTLSLPGLTPLTGTIQHGHFWLKGRDEFDRSIVRIIECRN